MNFFPDLTRNQWLWMGGAVALGVAEVVSAPIAVALAALPVLDHYASDQNGTRSRERSPSADGTAPRRRSTPRKRAGTRGGARRQTATATTS